MNQTRTLPPRILLLGGDIRGNMGDRAIRAALIQLIRETAPDAEFYAMSHQPERDRREFGVRVLGSNTFALVTRLPDLRRMALAVWGGGQLLQDDTSLAKNLYWAVVLAWVRRIAGLPIIGMGVGIGPLTRRAGILFARLAVRNLVRCVGRDPETCAWVRRFTKGRTPVRQAVDAALFLRPAPPGRMDRPACESRMAHRSGDEVVFGVAVRRWFHLKKNPVLPYRWGAGRWGGLPVENERMEVFIREMGTALKRLGRQCRLRLLLFPMAGMRWEREDVLSGKLAGAAGLPARVLSLSGCDAATVKTLAGACDLFVTMRMHGAILAAGMEVPPITISPTPKSAYFHHALEMQDWVLDVNACAVEGGAEIMYALFRRALDQRPNLAEHLRKRIAELQTDMNVYRDIVHQMLDRTGTPR